MYLSDETIESVFSVEYNVLQQKDIYADILEEMRIKNETMQDEIQESY
jgi:hypothetical protein